jgi:hypothetical protein
MPTVYCEQTYSVTVQVEVSDEQLAALKDYHADPKANEQAKAEVCARIDAAITKMREEECLPLDWVSTYVTNEDGELFDL